MSDQPREPSEIVPVLVAVLICDAGVADPSTGKKNLIGIFDRVFVRSFPTSRAMSVYLKLTDAEGEYRLSVRYIQTSSGRMLAEGRGEMKLTDRLTSTDAIFSFPPVSIPEAGRYEFQVWVNDAYLGGAFLDAVRLG
jgi:Family of unknown function (DUF6941)